MEYKIFNDYVQNSRILVSRQILRRTRNAGAIKLGSISGVDARACDRAPLQASNLAFAVDGFSDCSNRIMLPTEILETINHDFPCRELQIRQLLALLSVRKGPISNNTY